MMTINRMMEENSILSKLEAKDLSELIEKAQKKRYLKGDFICYQDEIWEQIAFVSFGEVKWTLNSPNGKRQIVFGLEEGNIVLGHSLFDGKGMPASLEVVTDCEVYLWSKDIVVPILSRNPLVLWEVMKTLVTNMRMVRDVVYGFSFHPASKRLARLILNHYNLDNGEVAPRDLTLDELAAEVGTTRELISKILNDFAREGIINITRGYIVFKNKDKLEEIAERKIMK